MKGLVLLAALLAHARAAIDVSALYGAPAQAGEGTYYGPLSGGGNCGLLEPEEGAWASGLQRVAMNRAQYDASATCGLCVRVSSAQNQGGGCTDAFPASFDAYVVDQCPECAAGDLDWSRASSGGGRCAITWEAIECPVGGASIQYQMEGSNPYYLKIRVRNHRVAVGRFFVENPSGTWREAFRSDGDNAFVLSSVEPPIEGPFNVRLVSVFDETLEDSLPGVSNGVILSSAGAGVQFSGGASSTLAPPTSAPPVSGASATAGACLLLSCALLFL